MKQRFTILLVTIMSIFITTSCTKTEKVGPNHFTKKTNWKVTELTIGGVDVPVLPEWEISTTESSTWCHEGGTCAKFYWNFSQNNNRFTFYLDVDDSENKINKAYKQCENLSGEYRVLTSKKNKFEIETNKTNGYVGPRVYFKLE